MRTAFTKRSGGKGTVRVVVELYVHDVAVEFHYDNHGMQGPPYEESAQIADHKEVEQKVAEWLMGLEKGTIVEEIVGAIDDMTLIEYHTDRDEPDEDDRDYLEDWS